MKLVGLLVLICLIACTKKQNYLPTSPQMIRVISSEDEILIPTVLWEELESVYRPPIFDNTAKIENEETEAKLEKPKDFFSFHVYLNEKTPGVLRNSHGYDLHISAPGGIVEMSRYLSGRRGSLYFGFKPDLELQKDDHFRIFYYSHAKSVELGGEVFGSGCNKYFDLTSYFNKAMAGDGISLNTTEGRHIALLAGSYFFAVSLKGKLYLSQLTVRDSRFKSLLCPGSKELSKNNLDSY